MPSLRTALVFVVTVTTVALGSPAARDALAASPKVRKPSADASPPAPATKRTASILRRVPRGKKVAPAAPALDASTATPAGRAAKPTLTKVKPPCLRDAIGVQRGTEEARFSLTRCDGSPAPFAVEHLSVLARPDAMSLPPANIASLAKRAGSDLAPGVRRLDVRLVDRLQTIVDHFARGPSAASSAPRVVLVSGYRPTSKGSYHAHGRALDFRLDGVKNEELVAFCKTLTDTGCGYYPNSSFVHLDVREPGTGHVAWIDGSGPGESPHYVSAWPPAPSDAPSKPSSEPVDPTRKLDAESPEVPVDEHPSTPQTDQDQDPEKELAPLPAFETPATSEDTDSEAAKP